MLETQPTFKRIFILVFLMLVAYGATFLSRPQYLELTREDGFFEILTALGFLFSAIGCFLLSIRKTNFFHGRDQMTFNTFPKRICFLLLGLVFFFGFGEEISWGQRIFGFGTPEYFQEKNVQGEFTIHNLEAFHLWDKDHNRKKGIAALFTMKKLFVFFFIGLLFINPLLYNSASWIKNIYKKLYIPVPPIWLGVLFVSNIIFFKFFKSIISDGIIIDELSEIEEFNFALLLILFPLFWLKFPKVRKQKMAAVKT